MHKKGVRFLVPGDFSNHHFSRDQELYIHMLAQIGDGKIDLLHISRAKRATVGLDPMALFRSESYDNDCGANLCRLAKKLQHGGIEVNCNLSENSRRTGEIHDLISDLNPDLIVLRNEPKSAKYEKFSSQVPLLLLPREIPHIVPGRIVLSTHFDTLPNPEKMNLFNHLANRITGELEIVKWQSDQTSSYHRNLLPKEIDLPIFTAPKTSAWEAMLGKSRLGSLIRQIQTPFLYHEVQ